MRPNRTFAALLALLAQLVLPASPAAAAPGDHDQTFGVGGVVRYRLSPISSTGTPAWAIADGFAQDTGRIVVVGTELRGGSVFGVTLGGFTAEGALDPTFGDAGLVRGLFGDLAPRAVDAALAPDGGVIVLARHGTDYGWPTLLLGRVRPDGSIDEGFGSGGLATAPTGLFGFSPETVAIDPAGRILVGGNACFDGEGDECRSSAGAIAAYHPGGAPDLGFGTGGLASDSTRRIDRVFSLLPLADTSILVAGSGTVTRLRSDGTPDPRFGTVTGVPLTPHAMALERTGSILVAGGSRLYRVAPGGGGGLLLVEDGSMDVRDMTLDPIGRIVVTGKSCTDPQCFEGGFLVRRYQSNGEPDLSFGEKGRVENDYGWWNRAEAVTVDAAGRLLSVGGAMLGSTIGELLMIRYEGGGPDPADAADLRVTTTTEAPSPVRDRDLVTYVVAVENLGPGSAPYPMLEETLPAGAGFVSTTAVDPTATCADPQDRVVTCRWRIVAPGERTEFRFTVRAGRVGRITNVARARALPYDTHSSNDVSIVRTPVLPSCTIVGTDGADRLTGTTGPDVICGGGGDDVVDAKGGADQIWGAEGDDVLLGGNGPDVLFGDEGDDVLLAIDQVSGNDHVDGGSGSDRCKRDQGDTKANCP